MKLVLLRHGQSIWNKENKFTGWTDVELSSKGITEAKEAGIILKEKGYHFDLAYTSVLKRAEDTLNIILSEMDEKNIEITSYFESDIINHSIDYINDKNICICGNENNDLFIGNSIYFDNGNLNHVEFEGKKEGFIGRNGTIQFPISMNAGSSYGNYISNGNDVIMSLRSRIKLDTYD